MKEQEPNDKGIEHAREVFFRILKECVESGDDFELIELENGEWFLRKKELCQNT